MFTIGEKTNKIYLTKGDDAQLVVSLYDKDGNEREIWSDDVITLTVKKRGKTAAITKTAENGIINFVPSDTKSLTTGLYYYDLQLTTFGGKVYTLIPSTIFEIGEEITV